MSTFKKYIVRFNPPNVTEVRELRFKTATDIINHFNISSLSVYYKIKAKTMKFKHASTHHYQYLEIIKIKRPVSNESEGHREYLESRF